MRWLAALLLLSATSAFAASFDGVWQGTGKTGGHFRYMIHGEDVRLYSEHDGQFLEDASCSFGIERKRRSATIVVQECAVDGAVAAMVDDYRLQAKGANTLRVRHESLGNRRGESIWVRVR